MISRDILQLDLHVPFNRFANCVVLFAFVVSPENDAVLDILTILLWTDPSRFGADFWVLVVKIVFFVLAEDLKLGTVGDRWGLNVRKLVNVIVYDLSQVDDGSFLELNLTFLIQLHASRMEESHVSDIVLSIDGANHKLCLP